MHSATQNTSPAFSTAGIIWLKLAVIYLFLNLKK